MTAAPTLPVVQGALESGLNEGVAPALAAAVIHRGVLAHASWHGTIPVAGDARPLGPGDLFDVASLTKVLITATVAAQLVDEGALALDEPAARWVPGFERGGKAKVTIRHLLAHTSGLVGWRPWFERCMADPVARAVFLPPPERPMLAALRDAFRRGREMMREAVSAEPLEAEPGTRAVYSDAGFIALGFALEEAAGAPIARLADARVSGPLELSSTFFLDGLDPERVRQRAQGRAFAPTERCAHRHEVNQGAVNDDNAWAMGGAAGHAGLFSTATEVAAIGQAWLDALHGRASIVPAAMAEEFARLDRTPGTTRALGWDTPSAESSSIGTRLGRSGRGAIGHLGFTGSSLWIDVELEVVVALLTNRVHPSRENERIRAFRPRFHDVVAEAFGIG